MLLGLLVSLILHLTALPLVLNSSSSAKISAPGPIAVTFEPTSRSQQIVSPPDNSASAREPESARRSDKISDKNFETEREMVKRGMPAAGGQPSAPASRVAFVPPGEPQPKFKEPVRGEQRVVLRPRQAAPVPDAEVALDQRPEPIKERQRNLERTPLRLDRSALVDAFGAEPRKSVAESAPKPQPFSRAPGAGAAFFGSGGSPDYLPSLPDGDMTMLNAKASKYATFVRRVAVQVFTALRTQGWESLSGGEINAAGGSTFARAVLSSKGDFLSVQIVTRSGSGGFDSVVASSIKTGARDPNPPADAAADDGTYRFVFEARSWAVRASDPRTGAPSERRWLMLGTGLE